jgi:hypothetical protein
MEALKESVKRAQEVGEGTSKRLDRVSENISDLVESMKLSVDASQQSMMIAFHKMLQGVDFAPALHSPFSQGQYPLVFGFKSPPNPCEAVMAPPPPKIPQTETPPPSLSGVPLPGSTGPEQNLAQLAKLVLFATDVSNSRSAHGRGTQEDFGRTNQNLEAGPMVALAGRSSLLENVLCSDPRQCTPSEEEVQVQKKVLSSSSKSCDVEPLHQSNAVHDDGDNHGIAIVELSSMPPPSGSPNGNTDELSFEDGDECGSQHSVDGSDDTHRPSFRPTQDEERMLHFSDEEQLDYGPSPVQEKKDEEEENDVYSLSALSPPHMVFHEVREGTL